MAKKRKMTRAKKNEYTKKNICWKCGSQLKRNLKKIECSNNKCTFEVILV